MSRLWVRVAPRARTLMGWHPRSRPRLATFAVWRKPEGPGAALGTWSNLTATSASGRPLGDR